jgi:Fe-S oxidoreductase
MDMPVEMPSCTGCKTCEMACSFKHKQEFNPKLSAIAVVPNDKKAGYLILINREDPNRAIDCTGCLECLKLCPVSEDLKAIIVAHRKLRSGPGDRRAVHGPDKR